MLVYGYQDAVIMKKMKIPDMTKELKALYKKIEPRIAKYGELSDQEIDAIIQTHRKVPRNLRVDRGLLKEGYVQSYKELKRMSKEWSSAETLWPE